MVLTHLIDLSAVCRLQSHQVRKVVGPLAAAGQVGRAGITDLEIGYGARNVREWEEGQKDLSIFELVETTAEHLRRVRQVQGALASKDTRGCEIPHLLAAAAAEQAGLTVLHYDADFDRIAAVTGQACEWVVPPGTLD